MIEDTKVSTKKEVKDSESCCDDTSCCPPKSPIIRATPKIGRNDPCPCDSGRKYKKCCGQYV